MFVKKYLDSLNKGKEKPGKEKAKAGKPGEAKAEKAKPKAGKPGEEKAKAEAGKADGILPEEVPKDAKASDSKKGAGASDSKPNIEQKKEKEEIDETEEEDNEDIQAMNFNTDNITPENEYNFLVAYSRFDDRLRDKFNEEKPNHIPIDESKFTEELEKQVSLGDINRLFDECVAKKTDITDFIQSRNLDQIMTRVSVDALMAQFDEERKITFPREIEDKLREMKQKFDEQPSSFTYDSDTVFTYENTRFLLVRARLLQNYYFMPMILDFLKQSYDRLIEVLGEYIKDDNPSLFRDLEAVKNSLDLYNKGLTNGIRSIIDRIELKSITPASSIIDSLYQYIASYIKLLEIKKEIEASDIHTQIKDISTRKLPRKRNLTEQAYLQANPAPEITSELVTQSRVYTDLFYKTRKIYNSSKKKLFAGNSYRDDLIKYSRDITLIKSEIEIVNNIVKKVNPDSLKSNYDYNDSEEFTKRRHVHLKNRVYGQGPKFRGLMRSKKKDFWGAINLPRDNLYYLDFNNFLKTLPDLEAESMQKKLEKELKNKLEASDDDEDDWDEDPKPKKDKEEIEKIARQKIKKEVDDHKKTIKKDCERLSEKNIRFLLSTDDYDYLLSLEESVKGFTSELKIIKKLLEEVYQIMHL